MRLNPYLNATIAAAYIWAVEFFIRLFAPGPDTPDTFITPIIAISLLVFSVALMGFLFFYRPVALMLERKMDEAAAFFLKTLVSFGAIALAVILMASLLYR